jgi:acetyl esterase/lipase
MLVWIHGGGWVRGMLDSVGGMARELAGRALGRAGERLDEGAASS